MASGNWLRSQYLHICTLREIDGLVLIWKWHHAVDTEFLGSIVQSVLNDADFGKAIADFTEERFKVGPCAANWSSRMLTSRTPIFQTLTHAFSASAISSLKMILHHDFLPSALSSSTSNNRPPGKSRPFFPSLSAALSSLLADDWPPRS